MHGAIRLQLSHGSPIADAPCALQEEAFALWNEWSLLYPAKSEARTFLRSLSDSRWLVSVVHHDYKDRDALWHWLMRLQPAEPEGVDAEGR